MKPLLQEYACQIAYDHCLPTEVDWESIENYEPVVIWCKIAGMIQNRILRQDYEDGLIK